MEWWRIAVVVPNVVLVCLSLLVGLAGPFWAGVTGLVLGELYGYGVLCVGLPVG